MTLIEELKQLGDNAKKDVKQLYGKVKVYPLISLLFIITVFLLIALPHWQVSGINDITEKVIQENQFRATLAQILGGVAIGIGLYYTWRRIAIAEEDLKITQENLKIAQEGQITERFTRAIEQLGNDKLEVRLGGIYALKRIANESKTDYWSIIEILTAYVRKNSPIEDKNVNNEEVEAPKKLSLDIQAILTVIRRCKPSLNTDEANYFSEDNRLIYDTNYVVENANYIIEAPTYLDFHDTYLWEADLFDAHFQGANFRGANLSEANLSNTKFEGASLVKANLKKARLWEAKFTGAFLMGAHLEEASLFQANLKYSFLTGAHLEGANFQNANLEMTFFADAHLEGAQLLEANLKEAYLSKANLKEAYLSKANLREANLREANLEGADLKEANLEGANLSKAKLKGAKNLTIDQLSKVKTLYGTELDDLLRIPLEKEYSHLFKNLKDEP
ncbi:Pentapeptide repeat family protein [Methanosarcina siciliae T4/M]|uniref:Pentapeptide repeat family protein n=1 Tax=Methanosarcina siciliae T4/M TaxID=1434120 RepID=A0A0E3P6T7_9EURY|nr:pentapeptide repeat-containing protein [Methanosarcina siciliae]AKB29518.1 Pentapeptide repeat family protein [Methanosarcina siciliae T4/M]